VTLPGSSADLVNKTQTQHGGPRLFGPNWYPEPLAGFPGVALGQRHYNSTRIVANVACPNSYPETFADSPGVALGPVRCCRSAASQHAIAHYRASCAPLGAQHTAIHSDAATVRLSRMMSWKRQYWVQHMARVRDSDAPHSEQRRISIAVLLFSTRLPLCMFRSQREKIRQVLSTSTGLPVDLISGHNSPAEAVRYCSRGEL
jgi:hypothetical protein